MVKILVNCLFIALAVNSAFARNIRAGCTFSTNSNSYPSPQTLVLVPGGEGNDAYKWPINGNLVFEEGEVVTLACPNSVVKVAGKSIGYESADAKCVGGQFEIANLTSVFNKITCSTTPYHTARLTGKTCLDGAGEEIEIGFKLIEGRFIRSMLNCFNTETQGMMYSEFNLTKHIDGYQSGYPRPNFIEGNFFDVGGKSVETLYKRNTERTTINALVGLAATSAKYIHASNDYFMSRGHLTAKADFVYGAHMRETFYYVNMVPQWQTFNGQNWNTLEQDVRAYAADNAQDLIVYTGTHGVATLPHETTGEAIELYLYVNGKERKIPVPALLYKAVRNPKTNEAIVLIGVNNPYRSDVSDQIVCTDICDQISWLKWKPTDVQKGYSYCCSVEDARQVIKTIPEFPVDAILT